MANCESLAEPKPKFKCVKNCSYRRQRQRQRQRHRDIATIANSVCHSFFQRADLHMYEYTHTRTDTQFDGFKVCGQAVAGRRGGYCGVGLAFCAVTSAAPKADAEVVVVAASLVVALCPRCNAMLHRITGAACRLWLAAAEGRAVWGGWRRSNSGVNLITSITIRFERSGRTACAFY